MECGINYNIQKFWEGSNMSIKYENIKYLIIDVDGTMTDAGIYYDEQGNELKKFCTKDAAGFFAAKAVGIKIMVLTGRESATVLRRMQELKVDYIVQGIKDKKTYLINFFEEKNLKKENIGYIGDDLNDLEGMRMSGFVGCPQDACDEVLEIADYKSSYKGGEGAVRDVICHLLRCRDEWQNAIEKVYGAGV